MNEILLGGLIAAGISAPFLLGLLREAKRRKEASMKKAKVVAKRRQYKR